MSERPTRNLCAIYTRKSVEDGLEQEFNSLDAQREAGEAFIASQKGNGWICLPEHYDDGGFSGGTLERPALKRLLRDAEAGLVDTIVVYKIDRLSRSLIDFSELNRTLDALKINFVAVTQDINTSTSSGRMMLNILMTFAQYEREIIAERTRDKMSASRRRGKWVGGSVPYGYLVKDKKLVMEPAEAAVVRRVFKRFLEIASPKQIAYELNLEGILSKQNRPWNKDHIYRMLHNHTYIGEVNYKGEICKGEQLSIIDRVVWDAVHHKSGDYVNLDGKGRVEIVAPLKGVARCGHCGCAMIPTYGLKGNKRYYYYICSKNDKTHLSKCPVKRIAAANFEKMVVEQVGKLFCAPFFITQIQSATGLPEAKIRDAFSNANSLWEHMYPMERNRLLRLLVAQVEIFEDRLELELKTDGMKSLISEVIHE